MCESRQIARGGGRCQGGSVRKGFKLSPGTYPMRIGDVSNRPFDADHLEKRRYLLEPSFGKRGCDKADISKRSAISLNEGKAFSE